MKKLPRSVLATLLITLTTVLSLGAQPTASATWIPEPDDDPFYEVPVDIADYEPGEVIRSRRTVSTLLNLPVPVNSWQLLYRTTDVDESPTATVTTVLVPISSWSGSGTRPLVSYQLAEDGVDTSCAPSYVLRAGLGAGLGSAQFEAALMAAPLLKGWALTIPDFQGPESRWLMSDMEGYAVLDGIRAARSFTDAGLATSKVGLMGYSGGAHAAAAAIERHPTYAPELPLVGAAMGGLPADLRATANHVDGTATSGFQVGAYVSMNRTYPELDLTSLLGADGKAAIADAEDDCLVSLIAKNLFLTRKGIGANGVDPFKSMKVNLPLKEGSMGNGYTPTVPIFEYHAILDQIVPLAQTDTQLRAWCDAGLRVSRKRVLVAEHATAAIRGIDDQVAFISDRFAGRTAPNQCWLI